MFSKDLYCRHIKTRACLGKVNYLSNNKILDLSKFKELADDKIDEDQALKIVFKRGENTVVKQKKKNAGYQHFIVFTECFSKAFFLRLVKSSDTKIKV